MKLCPQEASCVIVPHFIHISSSTDSSLLFRSSRSVKWSWTFHSPVLYLVLLLHFLASYPIHPFWWQDSPPTTYSWIFEGLTPTGQTWSGEPWTGGKPGLPGYLCSPVHRSTLCHCATDDKPYPITGITLTKTFFLKLTGFYGIVPNKIPYQWQRPGQRTDQPSKCWVCFVVPRQSSTNFSLAAPGAMNYHI